MPRHQEQARMGLRRVTGFFCIFALGTVSGALLLRASVIRPVSESEAQRRALRVLDQTPTTLNIGDNRIVEAVKKIEPAVVNIDTVGRAHNQSENGTSFYGNQEVRGKGS